MINKNWSNMYLDAHLLNLIAFIADHLPIILYYDVDINVRHKYSFKFENAWLNEEGLIEVVQNGWLKNPTGDVTEKISKCT